MSTKPLYRPDIDGLRAASVLAVVLYHYGAPWIPGGFTGVDVFFVVSGYLITTILRRELRDDSFSLARFYGRRARRILPALLVMLVVVLGGAWFVLLPAEYAALGEGAVAAALGLGNLYFYAHTGYFDRAAELQPLLHTWSLGVEEQFYFVWPALLWAGAKLWGQSRKLAFLVAVATLVGFAYAVRKVGHDPVGAFYLPHPRAWELGLGALVSFAPLLRNRLTANLLGAIGFCLVGWSFFQVTAGDPFPGFNALYACLGAALLLWPAPPSIASKVLSARPAVAIGLISYSLYLWHWPILVLFRLANLERMPNPLEAAALIGATAIVSVASYQIVERPGRHLRPRSSVFLVASAIVVVALGVATIATQGVPARIPDRVLQLANGASDYSARRSECHRSEDFDPPLDSSCIYGDARQIPTVPIWGDSHGVELVEAFGPELMKRGTSAVQLTYSSCPPVLGFASPLQKGCESFAGSALDYLGRHPEITEVFLTTYYDLYAADKDGLWAGLRSTLAELSQQGKKVVLVAPTPNPGYSVPQAAAKRSMVGANDLAMLASTHREKTKAIMDRIALLATEFPGLEVLDPSEALCSEVCRLVVDDQPVLFDDNHLSRHGAALVAAAYWTQH